MSEVANAEQHADDHGHGHGHHEPTEAELDRTPVGPIAIIIVALLVLLVGVVVGVYEYFRQEIATEISAKVLSHQSTALRELRAMEEQRLSRYQWVNQKDGVVRMPLPRAMELTLKDYREAAQKPAEQVPEAQAAAQAVPGAEENDAASKDARVKDTTSGKDAADEKKADDKKADDKKPADKKAEGKKYGEKKAPAPAPKAIEMTSGMRATTNRSASRSERSRVTNALPASGAA